MNTFYCGVWWWVFLYFWIEHNVNVQLKKKLGKLQPQNKWKVQTFRNGVILLATQQKYARLYTRILKQGNGFCCPLPNSSKTVFVMTGECMISPSLCVPQGCGILFSMRYRYFPWTCFKRSVSKKERNWRRRCRSWRDPAQTSLVFHPFTVTELFYQLNAWNWPFMDRMRVRRAQPLPSHLFLFLPYSGFPEKLLAPIHTGWREALEVSCPLSIAHLLHWLCLTSLF